MKETFIKDVRVMYHKEFEVVETQNKIKVWKVIRDDNMAENVGQIEISAILPKATNYSVGTKYECILKVPVK